MFLSTRSSLEEWIKGDELFLVHYFGIAEAEDFRVGQPLVFVHARIDIVFREENAISTGFSLSKKGFLNRYLCITASTVKACRGVSGKRG